ncbi:MAG: hypothetical protein IRZ33_00495 [Alicyclobacillaceae bacterium]|nr:hypothetical protein [Alicyclobacillaceae bacterium]
MDPLAWAHQWDEFEMMLYALPGDEQGGVFVQVSRRRVQNGAEEWEILYDRRVGDADATVTAEPGSEAWEEAVLRRFFNAHPDLVNAEKAYLRAFLAQRGEHS